MMSSRLPPLVAHRLLVGLVSLVLLAGALLPGWGWAGRSSAQAGPGWGAVCSALGDELRTAVPGLATASSPAPYPEDTPTLPKCPACVLHHLAWAPLPVLLATPVLLAPATGRWMPLWAAAPSAATPWSPLHPRAPPLAG